MSKPKISVYTTAACAFCHALKQYLASKNVPFEEIHVDTDMAKARDMVEKSGQMGVPVTDFDGTIVVGFNRPQIDQLLREHNLI